MKIIDAKLIEDTVARLCIEANLRLPEDVISAIKNAASVPGYRYGMRIS